MRFCFVQVVPIFATEAPAMRLNLMLLLLILPFLLKAQSSFDKYGMYGAEVYSNLETALKHEKEVYKLNLSYQTVDPRHFNKLSHLHNLQSLLLYSNSLNQWPSDFGKLNSLVYLGSFDNAFTGFPPGLCKLGNLMHLDLLGLKTDSIPDEIACLHHLRIFRFLNTNDSLKVSAKMRQMKSLQELSIEGVIVDSCPRSLFRIPSLRFLSLAGSKVKALPENLDKMHGLEVLILDHNELRSLPRGIYACNKLIHLSLRNNKLEKIPDTICHLQHLTHLDLRGNPLSKDAIEELKALLPGCKVLF